MINESKLLSIKQASRLLCVTPLTLRNWDKSGKLKALRHPLNNYRVYKRDDIEKLISSMTYESKPIPKKDRKSIRKLEVRHLDE